MRYNSRMSTEIIEPIYKQNLSAPTVDTPVGKGRVSLINLGCAKNEVDSEEMLGLLQSEGYGTEFAHNSKAVSADTDVVVINTCGFIEAAKEESINTILEALQRKERGEIKKVVVAGCLVQRYAHELAAGNARSGRLSGHRADAQRDAGRRRTPDPPGCPAAGRRKAAPPLAGHADPRPPRQPLDGLPENLRRLRPRLHLLRHSQFSGQARQQAVREDHIWRPSNWRRRACRRST